jgi:cellulose synthase/poly-beta-1,6-N-acetylglucosamine synthase-like glycosyltransferase
MIPTVKIIYKDRYLVINESDFNPLIHQLYHPPLKFPTSYLYGKPLVSICCDTYNHVSYIEQTIRGFLIQRTNFSFEIIIMDDASTDGTTDILKTYQKKYPKCHCVFIKGKGNGYICPARQR